MSRGKNLEGRLEVSGCDLSVHSGGLPGVLSDNFGSLPALPSGTPGREVGPGVARELGPGVPGNGISFADSISNILKELGF